MRISLGLWGLAWLAVGCATPSTDRIAEDVAKARTASFKGTGPEKDVTLGGHAAKLVPASDEVTALVEEMTAANHIQNDQFLAAVYTSSTEAFAQFSSPADGYRVQKNMGFDMMYRADGSTPGGREGFGWAETWRPEYEDMTCYRFARQNADARFKQFGAYKVHQGDDQIAEENRALIEKDATILVDSFLAGLGDEAKFYHCQWDNNDDTSSEALVSIDGTEARVVVGWEGG